jgi:magnesium chelatase family protein
MMSSKIYSGDVFGNLIEVQCKITRGLPTVQIVGLASKALEESKERVRAAFHTARLEFPKSKVLVNLSPADLPKDGSGYDLAIALTILQAGGIIRGLKHDIFATGEVALDGTILPVRGIIGRLSACKDTQSIKACIVPEQNHLQASLLNEMRFIPISSLNELIEIINGTKTVPETIKIPTLVTPQDTSYDEVKGQMLAKRALQISASGGHNILLYGPPGTGKSMLSKALMSLLPDLSKDQQLESTHLHSLRMSSYDSLIIRPPLRAPHHSSSNISVLGGGQKPRPGEISLAHNGVLFLDEFLEFSRSCIEALRQPLEDRVIQISRAEHAITYPASFILIATMNPCPCGHLGSSKECICAPNSIIQYQRKLSGPIIDRIDLFVKVEEVPINSLLMEPTKNQVESIRQKILTARSVQENRNRGILNSHLNNPQIRKLPLNDDAKVLLNNASERMKLSPRAYFRVLKVAQTIADIEAKSSIDTQSIAESLQFRENLPTYS